MKKTVLISSVLTTSIIALLAFQNSTDANSSNPNNGNAGAPMDNAGQTCTSCHGGIATQTTGVIFSDIPVSGYVAGSTYNFTVAMTGAAAYGFEITPQTSTSNTGLGTFISGINSTVSTKYIKHSNKITGTSAIWTFQWTAPTASTVTFYGAFAYANNNFSSSGDIIKTSSVSYTACNVTSTPLTITGNTTICSSSSNTYSVAPVSGAISYNWILPSGWLGSSTTNIISTVSGTTSGNISASATNTCGTSAIQTLSVVVNSIPVQSTSINGNTSICLGGSNTYSVAPISGATSYNWVLPSGWSGSSATNIISTLSGAASGNISVSADNSCGTSAIQTLSVVVNSIPAQPASISGNTTVCLGGSHTYSVAPVSGATSYNWILPSGWSGSSATNIISTIAGITSGNVSVSALNNCGVSTTQTLFVVVNSIPAQPTLISGNATICLGSSNTYSVTLVSGATSYDWILPTGWSGNSTTNTIFSTAGTTSGTISVSATNGCGGSVYQTLAVTVESMVTMPLAISGNTLICSSSLNPFSVTPVSGATSYSWILPSGWSGSSTTNTISSIAGTLGGTISVSAINSCGASASQTMDVIVSSGSALPQPNAINGNTVICSGSSNTYSVALVSGATSYNWTLPGGWSGNSSSNTIATTAGITSGTISVSAINSCGSSASQTLAISVSSIPPQPLTISGNTTICSGSSNTYSTTFVIGATSYNWILPSVWSGSSTANTISTLAGTINGTISVSAVNGCGASAFQTLAVAINTVDLSVTQSGLTLTSNQAGALYQWVNCANSSTISGATNQSFIATTNGIYKVNITKNGCSASSSCYTVANVGTTENNLSTTITIYPNPSNGKIQVYFSDMQTEKNYELEIYNVDGLKIYQSKYTTPNIDISNQSSGIYLMKIYDEQTFIIKKIIKN